MNRWLVASVVLLAALLCSACRGSSWGPVAFQPEPEGDWFVSVDGSDRNSGRTPEEAFATIGRAARRARPGETIVVGEGTYVGPVKTEVHGTRDRPIIYISSTPLGAKIDATGENAAWTNTGDYVDIIGFEVTGSDYIGIYNRASHVRVIGNWVHDLAVPSCNEPNGGAGIQHGNYEAHESQTLGNLVHGITPAGGYCNLIHGIYHSQVGGNIQNNIVYDVTARGIQTWHVARAVTITNNLVWNTETGILVGANDSDGSEYNVSNNILINNQFGIRESGHRSGDHNRFNNNLMYRNDEDFEVVTAEPKGTIFGDPRLVDFRADGSGDYRLRMDSPGIDAGTTGGAPDFDIRGVPRPQRETIDIGPYETPEAEAATNGSASR